MNSQKNSPEVLRFTSELSRRGGRLLLEIPAEISDKLRGMEKVEGMMNTQPFRAVIELGDDGNYLLHVNAAMQRGSEAEDGEMVQVAILGQEPAPVPQPDFQAEFDMSPEATASWNGLTTLGKRDWIRWIDDTKNPETRARRIARSIEQLSEGKRRACCVDVNGFMMCRIKEDSEADIVHG